MSLILSFTNPSSLSWIKYACSMMANDSRLSSKSPTIVRLKEMRDRQVFVGSSCPHSSRMTLCVTLCPCFCPIRLSFTNVILSSVLFTSVAQLCPTLCDPIDYSMPGFPVHHQLPELTQTHVHWVSDAIQPSHPLSSPSPSTFNLSQFQGLFQRVSSSHHVAKLLEFQLQHQSFQWIFRTHFLKDGLVDSPCSSRDSQESYLTPQFKNINVTLSWLKWIQAQHQIWR